MIRIDFVTRPSKNKVKEPQQKGGKICNNLDTEEPDDETLIQEGSWYVCTGSIDGGRQGPAARK